MIPLRRLEDELDRREWRDQRTSWVEWLSLAAWLISLAVVSAAALWMW